MITAASFDGSKADEEIIINAQLDLDDERVQVVVLKDEYCDVWDTPTWILSGFYPYFIWAEVGIACGALVRLGAKGWWRLP
ncbi:uncharacterized protein DS421_6g194470 [Arachis hypogaea]|nr:uncharacterized protein DS421_6g194470 [Arachis hypogaea]